MNMNDTKTDSASENAVNKMTGFHGLFTRIKSLFVEEGKWENEGDEFNPLHVPTIWDDLQIRAMTGIGCIRMEKLSKIEDEFNGETDALSELQAQAWTGLGAMFTRRKLSIADFEDMVTDDDSEAMVKKFNLTGFRANF